MGEKQCCKCGETVDEAKAFCPGCGNAFVEEKTRTSVSDFDLSDHTVKLGDTMYNQMLSDMGLSISRQANRDEPIEPAGAATPQSSPQRRPEPSLATPAKSKSIIIAVGIAVIVIGFALLAIIAIAVAAVLYFR